MTPTEFFHELVYPLRSARTLIALTTFLLLASIVVIAVSTVGVFALASIWLAVVLAVALMRYLMLVADARAQGVDAEPPGAEYFSLVGNLWTLFPAVIVFSAVFLADELRDAGLPDIAAAFVALVALGFPAMIGVLTITHSPLQCINPLAIGRYVGKLGPNYLYSLAAAAVPAAVMLLHRQLPVWVTMISGLYAAAAFFAVVGGLARTGRLADEVGIDEPAEPDEAVAALGLEKRRRAVLNHAYGFASRGNRAGGLGHIEQWIASDPDPDAARAWFFERMLDWDQQDHALFYAQRWLTELLAADQQVRAVKVMLRCRMIEPRFRPAAGDLERAVAAAEACDNAELAAALKRL